MIDKKISKQFENLDLLANQVVEGFITGLHKSPFHGFSVEFAEHRLYNTGESTKYIDWKLFARTDKLFIKRFEEETNLRCRIIIDQSSSMYFPDKDDIRIDNPNKLYFSVICAASIMNLLKRQRDAIGLSLFSDKVHFHSSDKTSTKHHKFLLKELEKLLNKTKLLQNSRVVEALHQIAENINQRSLVILFSDMFDNSNKSDDLFSALQHLKFNKHEVVLFHVIDQSKEVKLEYENRPYKFVDMETGEELKLSPNDIKHNYIQQSKEFLNTLKLKCNHLKIDFIEADINSGIKPILFSYLRKRSRFY